MTTTSTTKRPKCHKCGKPIAEGERIVTGSSLVVTGSRYGTRGHTARKNFGHEGICPDFQPVVWEWDPEARLADVDGWMAVLSALGTDLSFAGVKVDGYTVSVQARYADSARTILAGWVLAL